MSILLFIGIALISYLVQANLKAKMNKYSRQLLASGLTGREVAERMLRENGIYNVSVTCTPGFLTDHYNPTTATVNLSEAVYHGRSVASAAVAAHECGHAVQHATAYGPLTLRTALVPAVTFTSSIVSWVLLAGILLIEVVPQIMLGGIILFALTTLFSFVTLPVEIDASRRATRWLEASGVAAPYEKQAVVSALSSAAYTYVAAALSSLATLIYYVLQFMAHSSSDD